MSMGLLLCLCGAAGFILSPLPFLRLRGWKGECKGLFCVMRERVLRRDRKAVPGEALQFS